MLRRRDLMIAAGAALLSARSVRAQGSWPGRPIRWLVGFPPGGANDVTARLIGQGVSARVGQPVVVENRPGTGALVASEAAVRSAPDGLTWLSVGNGPLVYNPALFPTMSFDPDKDLRGIGFIGRFPLLLVTRADQPATDLAALVAATGPAPNYGTAGIASPHHLAGEMLKRRSGWKAEHVPYRGIPAAMNDLLGGQVQFVVSDLAAALPMIQAGRIRALLLLSETRHPLLPGVPTVVEAGHPDAVAFGWQGVSVPAATPDALVAQMGAVFEAVMADPSVKDKLVEMGVDLVPTSPSAFDAFVKREIAVWRPLIRDLGIKMEN